MPDQLADTLQGAIDADLPVLQALTETEVSASLHAGWTPKQELGHLIDSAANNHIRFVRATLEGDYEGPGYDADAWVLLHNYANAPWSRLVNLWYGYNCMLVDLVRTIPEDRLSSQCIVSNGTPVSLRFLISDYVVHMQHHLDHAIGRQRVTAYPPA